MMIQKLKKSFPFLYAYEMRFRGASKFFVIVVISTLLCACTPRYLIVQGVANELASQDQATEEDLELVRESSAFYLKFSESVLLKTSGNLKLAEAVAAGFTQYAYAFVSFEAERIEAKDVKASHKLRGRAARLYLRAHRHAMTALEQHQPGFLKALSSSNSANWPRLDNSEVGVAYWAAASWGGYISLSKDDPDAVADLPLAIRLARLAWEKMPYYGDGALASLMGNFEMARPGGSNQQAVAFFDQAIASSAGKNAGVFVAKAESIALPAGDRVAFEALLLQALAVSKERKNLPNEVMRERALWLLETADNLF
ncbi:MAG: TRAP transporter TatT component family protein [Gallionellaceae bacterium]|nr:TRAP transporter TatT component family protein [Gallionellaceae bacterium]